MKILIIHTFGLGDMIMLTPALQKFITLYPNAKIDFLIFQKISAEPIKNFSNINKIYFSDMKITNILNTIFQLRKIYYDKIITTSGTNSNKIAFFYQFLKGKEKIAEYKKDYQKTFFDIPIKYIENIHRVENNSLLFFDTKNIDFQYKFFGIKKTDMQKKNIQIGIHSGSNPKFSQKRWNKEYFVELINLLNRNFNNLEFIIFAGPGEIEESIYIAEKTNSSIVKNKNLKEVAKMISECDIFINTDSGLGHIAGCFDLEIFTIFGPAKDYKARVYSNNAYTIKLDLSCQPCYGTDRLKKCTNFECLNNLTPNIVFQYIIKKSKILNDD